MTNSTRVPRRTFLRGLGASMALPLLECMRPASLISSAAAAQSSSASPVRMAFVFFPNGAIMPNWKPQGEGADYTLSHTLEPLADFKGDFNVLDRVGAG